MFVVLQIDLRERHLYDNDSSAVAVQRGAVAEVLDESNDQYLCDFFWTEAGAGRPSWWIDKGWVAEAELITFEVQYAFTKQDGIARRLDNSIKQWILSAWKTILKNGAFSQKLIVRYNKGDGWQRHID